jgi:hypothetical protein
MRSENELRKVAERMVSLQMKARAVALTMAAAAAATAEAAATAAAPSIPSFVLMVYRSSS